LVLFILLLGLSGLISSSETAMFSLNSVQLEQMRQAGNPNIGLIERLLHELCGHLRIKLPRGRYAATVKIFLSKRSALPLKSGTCPSTPPGAPNLSSAVPL
jgi:hypothetical protein